MIDKTARRKRGMKRAESVAVVLELNHCVLASFPMIFLLTLLFSSCHVSGGWMPRLSHSRQLEWASRQGDGQSLPAEVQRREPAGQLLHSGEHYKSQFTGFKKNNNDNNQAISRRMFVLRRFWVSSILVLLRLHIYWAVYSCVILSHVCMSLCAFFSGFLVHPTLWSSQLWRQCAQGIQTPVNWATANLWTVSLLWVTHTHVSSIINMYYL